MIEHNQKEKEKGGHDHGHDHGGHGGCASHSATTRYYMPKERMTTLDTVIYDLLFDSKTFFTCDNHHRLKAVLSQIHESRAHILNKGKEKGMLAHLD